VQRYLIGFKFWRSHFFMDLFRDFPAYIMVSDVPVDDEAPVVTSRISRSAGAQSSGGADKGKVCVRVFIEVSVRACCECMRCTV
jgi:hypothetical protein